MINGQDHIKEISELISHRWIWKQKVVFRARSQEVSGNSDWHLIPLVK